MIGMVFGESCPGVRRYLAVVQDERGYPPPGALDPAPPDGPKPPMLHTAVLATDYEAAERRVRDLEAALRAIKSYSSGQHHDPACGEDACIECLIHGTAEAALGGEAWQPASDTSTKEPF